MPAIFLSYRREDSAGYAGRLRESIERRLGRGSVFRDVDGIGPGQDFVHAIDGQLRECRSFLAVIGREWPDAADFAKHRRLDDENDYVRLEIAAALARPDVLVVPVLVEGMTLPRSEELPEAIRSLTRRQAVSLRDETWDADVDRLLAGLPAAAPVRVASRAKWVAVAAAVAALAVVTVAVMLMTGGRDTENPADTGIGRTSPSFAPPSVASRRSGPSQTAATAAPAAIAIPKLAELVNRSTIHTLLSGSIAPHGATTTLALRVRFSNDGSYPVLFGDGYFRLAVGADVLAPTSFLSEAVAGHSLRQGVITFEVPREAKQAILRWQMQEMKADIPLELISTGAAGETDRPDTRDALSHAIIGDLVREPRPLAAGKDVSYTLTRAYARRFVNAIRVVFTVRVANRRQYGLAFTGQPFRVLAEGQAEAPVESPIEPVAGNADASGDLVFDVLPTTRSIVLRVRDQDRVADLPFDLPPNVR